MKNTLLLRLGGVMQSWGVHSRFGVRDTGLEPSKSGVIGLACAAMGVDREDDLALAQLAQLRMGVRVDREGRLKMDYHTAQDVLRAGGGTKPTEVSRRYYIADALFLVGLEGEDLEILKRLQSALQNPIWPLFLGRKAFVPGEPVCLPDGLKPGLPLMEALDPRTYPYMGRSPQPDRLRIIIEDPSGGIIRADQPLSFSQKRRRFAPRRLSITYIPNKGISTQEVEAT
jgi:CRISPR system Cascade subunit CasD